jgi:uncharacterized membrane protein HdeD (DUF308 family)
MKAVKTLKPYFGLIGLLVGGGMVKFLMPSDFLEGLLILAFGYIVGGYDQKFNPTIRAPKGPLVPWEEMDTSDRAAYFLIPILLVILGVIATISWFDPSQEAMDWRDGMIGAVWIVVGLDMGFRKWRNRYCSRLP